jgi:hypothetical protein
MAPLPENTTDRFWLDYTDGINPHSFQARFAGGLTAVPNIATQVDNFFLALSPILYGLTVLGARFSLAGTTISQPYTWTGEASYGNFAMPATLAPRQLCFLGRGADGRRVRWFVFGWEAAPPTPFRLDLSNPAELGDAWAILQAGPGTDAFLTISGGDPNLYSYVDVNYNSYFEEKAR